MKIYVLIYALLIFTEITKVIQEEKPEEKKTIITRKRRKSRTICLVQKHSRAYLAMRISL